ncbi:MAG TPA: glycoside hydrolase family 98 domain-containing protein [Candidatus Hydrogenedentes bacterium]|nr:glycoside hydrolase family 98 domain-containing protein [Candidatus Hydrogenedentota bacterium]HOL77001.1 glycoside hydrolase family 98 domain-containing protein [Candidatus Hydrogenedentota bacterium]HPO85816.1 glycoside hydrolase family 98 domain-containing protein [Candidatus Hydrogenedentota bacterium]
MENKVPPVTRIAPDHPLIILQTSNRFGDCDEDYGIRADKREEAVRHGKEAVRAWREAVPDDIKPYCQLQIEVRTRDHTDRYETFRRIFSELEAANIPANLQFADPHVQFVFDPEYIERLTEEFSYIKTYTITENRFEHYSPYNVPRYATPPEVRYTIDIIHLAAKHGKHLVIPLQDLKWMHIGADRLNQPLRQALEEYGEYVIPVNEHIGPRHIQRQTAVWGFWVAGLVQHWGVEPQSWWYENARMIEPGVFGQREPNNTRIMPPDLYRAMILLGASMGATVYDFEPFWDLFDYDNSVCWKRFIYPTLMEIIQRKMIPTREQVLEKIKVAYQYKEVGDIREFHEILKDIDWIGDAGLLSRAAYGLWQRYLEHELIPNKSRYYYIPLLPPNTPKHALDRFEKLIHVQECNTEEEYQRILDTYYPEPEDKGAAWITTINGYTYVMQTHENLYERQTYSILVPKPVRELAAERDPQGVRLTWGAVEGASMYHVYRLEGTSLPAPNGFSTTVWKAGEAPLDDPELMSAGITHVKDIPFRRPDPIQAYAHTEQTSFLDKNAEVGKSYVYTVTATTPVMERKEGTVNYLDYLVFSRTESQPVVQILVMAEGSIHTQPVEDPKDQRPASQVWHPIWEGVPDGCRDMAQKIVARIDEFKEAYDSRDLERVKDLYSRSYTDPNGYHWEYAYRAWKWWFFRNNSFCMLRQIRRWDFSDYERTGEVRVRLFSLFRACRYDDQPFGHGYDGTVRIPRHADEEVTYSWKQEADGKWRIVKTDPALPNFNEMLWNSRGCDCREKLVPGVD